MRSDKRISNYLEKIEPAVSGQNGHGQTFHVAKILIHGFGLSVSEALPFMRTYSARCAPPWSDRELKHKLESAVKTGPGKIRKL
jgi:putative DNA primase/helicase